MPTRINYFSIIIAFCTQRIDIFDKDFWVVSQNYLKRKRDLYKIKQCIYILDNTWRRREDEQREAIYFRGDIPIFNPAGEIINSNYGLNVIEAGHLKSAYVYKTRWNLCRKIAEELEPKIEEYEKKLKKKQRRKTARAASRGKTAVRTPSKKNTKKASNYPPPKNKTMSRM